MDSIPDSTIVYVLETMKQLGLHYYELLSGTEDKVDELRNQLNTLNSVIDKFTTDYLKREDDNKAIHALIKEIRQVASVADVTIQKYEASAIKQKNRDLASKVFHFPRHVLNLEDVAEKIQKCTTKFEDFLQNRVEIILELPKDEPQKNEDLAVTKDDTPMVGLQDELERVVGRLRSNKDMTPEAVSIIGMAGSGKTKLALQVKDHPKIVHTFNPRVLVNVTQGYKRREVLIKMLAEIKQTHEGKNNMSDGEIEKAVQEELTDKRYMIVLDDVWEDNVFKELKMLLPDNAGSKVLITSRNSIVGTNANRSEDSTVKLGELDEKESMELLWREVFGDINCREDLKRYGKHIVSKCGKLPMSIMVIAGILRLNKESSDLWKDVSESVHSHVSKNENLSRLIGLSYHNLPEHLQRCFLYLGVFQEGSNISAWKLWQLWIAEGFVEKNEFSRSEVTAKSYLDALVARNLVSVEKRKANGQIKVCRLHNTVRYFCKLEAMKRNLFREIRMVGADTCEFTPTDAYCRGVCVHSNFMQYLGTEPSHEFVRSFLSFCQQEDTNRLSKKIASSFTNGFRLLRVLDARSIIFPVFADNFLHLVLLRYMNISLESNVLPEKVSNLKFLQTLIITKSKGQGPLQIRADIGKMLHLRHLHTNLSAILLPPPLKAPLDEYKISPNIQTLTRISSESCKAVVLKKTPNIKKLGVSGKLQDSSLFKCLSDLKLLEDLRLYNEGTQRCTFQVAEKHFPEKLTKLTLRNTLLDWGDMSILAQIKNLEVLKLKDNAFVGKYWGPMSMDKKFERLQVLHIRNAHLEEWKASANDFPALRSLILKNCRKLRGIPLDIGEIKNLQSIDLYATNEEVAGAAIKIKKVKIGLNLSVQDSESTIDDKDSDGQISEEDESRPVQDMAVHFFKRILFCCENP